MQLPMPPHARITLGSSKARYNVRIDPLWSSTGNVCRSLPVHSVSRGPPGRRRPELQAMSNSLQLT
jgi:hypothetical protein